jgi:hypothetical protein
MAHDAGPIRSAPEKIIRICELSMIFNYEKFLTTKKRVVDLACGHKAFTGNLERMVCPRCSEMLRRSISGDGEDYDSFRKGLTSDQMIWREDPLRCLNEPTNLSGEYSNP